MEAYYELIRPNNGTDVFLEYIVVKEPTHQKFLSDMPERNPELVGHAISQLSLSIP